MAYLKMYGGQISSPIKYKTMTVILDLNNSDPTTWATYADDAVGMTAGSDAWDTFFGHYPCILDNGVELGKLKRDNFAQYEDGTSAPITTLGKDVMICFPRRGIKIEYTDSSHLSVSMTDEEGKSGYSYMGHSYKGNACDKFYLGAYKGYISNNILYSTSAKTPTRNDTISNFRTYAHNKGTGYEQNAFYQLTFRQAMYLLKYKGQNAQVAIGRGFVDGNSDIYGNTGYTNDKGMDWGENTGKFPMKLFGLEDFYGNFTERVDGLITSTQGVLLASDGNYNDAGSGYTTVSSYTSSSGFQGYLRYPIGTNRGGFVPNISNKTYGSGTSYFCDTARITEKANYTPVFGGYWAHGNVTGVFMISITATSNYADPDTGARLMYMHVA